MKWNGAFPATFTLLMISLAKNYVLLPILKTEAVLTTLFFFIYIFLLYEAMGINSGRSCSGIEVGLEPGTIGSRVTLSTH